jgi:histidinol-phosphate aminotransferase
METNVERIRATRRRLSRELRNMGFAVLPSEANFVFARRPGRNVKALYEGLKSRGILVRHFDVPELEDGLRITVGTDEEVDRLLAALHEVLSAEY